MKKTEIKITPDAAMSKPDEEFSDEELQRFQRILEERERKRIEAIRASLGLATTQGFLRWNGSITVVHPAQFCAAAAANVPPEARCACAPGAQKTEVGPGELIEHPAGHRLPPAGSNWQHFSERPPGVGTVEERARLAAVRVSVARPESALAAIARDLSLCDEQATIVQRRREDLQGLAAKKRDELAAANSAVETFLASLPPGVRESLENPAPAAKPAPTTEELIERAIAERRLQRGRVSEVRDLLARGVALQDAIVEAGRVAVAE